MARPIKEGLDYFPLDVDIDQDDKTAIIEALHGIEGFGIFIKLLMKIYKEGYFYEWTKREQILFSKRVNVDINTVKEVVNDCINEGLFSKKIFNDYSILTSKGIQTRYLEAIKRRKEVKFIRKYFLITDIVSIIGNSNLAVLLVDDNENEVNVNINSINDNISTQRKGKEIERKGNRKESKTETAYSFYEKNVYPTVNGIIREKLNMYCDIFSDEIVIEALKRMLLKNKKDFSYAEGILVNWEDAKVKSLEDIKKLDAEFKANKPQQKGEAESEKDRIAKEFVKDYNLPF